MGLSSFHCSMSIGGGAGAGDEDCGGARAWGKAVFGGPRAGGASRAGASLGRGRRRRRAAHREADERQGEALALAQSEALGLRARSEAGAARGADVARAHAHMPARRPGVPRPLPAPDRDRRVAPAAPQARALCARRAQSRPIQGVGARLGEQRGEKVGGEARQGAAGPMGGWEGREVSVGAGLAVRGRPGPGRWVAGGWPLPIWRLPGAQRTWPLPRQPRGTPARPGTST
jgi:hypothetical protein